MRKTKEETEARSGNRRSSRLFQLCNACIIKNVYRWFVTKFHWCEQKMVVFTIQKCLAKDLMSIVLCYVLVSIDTQITAHALFTRNGIGAECEKVKIRPADNIAGLYLCTCNRNPKFFLIRERLADFFLQFVELLCFLKSIKVCQMSYDPTT